MIASNLVFNGVMAVIAAVKSAALIGTVEGSPGLAQVTVANVAAVNPSMVACMNSETNFNTLSVGLPR